MTSDRIQRRPRFAVSVVAALMALAPASIVCAADPSDSARSSGASDRAARNLQLGVGKSVIVDLPEEAGEIYVGDPKIANAIVRSARRVYISGVANGQTSIFALARDGRKIATIEVSVGRDVGELSSLLNAAIPDNDIHVRTVADKIILTGSVASADSNFGCASQSVIAAQVDDPRDFVQPRALGPSDVEMRTRAIEAVRNGQDPGTQWKDTVLVPIGTQVGGGGQ
jgi:Flp pilus assembly secretin CpaC